MAEFVQPAQRSGDEIQGKKPAESAIFRRKRAFSDTHFPPGMV
ncbi:hypothetical protein SUBVAR_06667 [Subdoligranulum variabile DSM 15176]|uniref:Uncharacterized protein n=1 Tax=Subdoligranulum variabile DSM 15176 TaxID=411471 RepID=D1PQJ8_9FIRM|nr:hypothetical protein SUBVAR_06667 [Subdoligranulum variabile DSM 15176]